MPDDAASDLLARARQSGLFPDEWFNELAMFAPDEALRSLKARDTLTAEQRSILDPSAVVLPGPVELMPIAQEETGVAFVPEPVTSDSPFPAPEPMQVRTRSEPPMTRQTMWTWFAFGGALWLVGFLMLGIWLGGCFDASPPSPRNGSSGP